MISSTSESSSITTARFLPRKLTTYHDISVTCGEKKKRKKERREKEKEKMKRWTYVRISAMLWCVEDVATIAFQAFLHVPRDLLLRVHVEGDGVRRPRD